MTRSIQKDRILAQSIERRCSVPISQDDARTLRRAEMTLQRWAEHECGDGNDYASWAIERDESSGIPYMARYPHTGKPSRYRIPDRERGALRRVDALCTRYGLHYFHQTDPRGCTLYVSTEILTDSNYTNGVACCS